MDMSILRKGSGDGLYATLCPIAVDYLDCIYKPDAPKTVLGWVLQSAFEFCVWTHRPKKIVMSHGENGAQGMWWFIF